MVEMVNAMGRLGTESAFEVLARANKLSAEGKDIINLGIGQSDFKTPDHIVEAAAKALRDGHHATRRRMASSSAARPWPPTLWRGAASQSTQTRS